MAGAHAAQDTRTDRSRGFDTGLSPDDFKLAFRNHAAGVA